MDSNEIFKEIQRILEQLINHLNEDRQRFEDDHYSGLGGLPAKERLVINQILTNLPYIYKHESPLVDWSKMRRFFVNYLNNSVEDPFLDNIDKILTFISEDFKVFLQWKHEQKVSDNELSLDEKYVRNTLSKVQQIENEMIGEKDISHFHDEWDDALFESIRYEILKEFKK